MTTPSDDSCSPGQNGPASPGSKPSLEQLLRLKRSERPDDSFWADFDRGMRQKQLAAIVEPKPWWLGLALVSRRLAPVGLPASAAAAALLAFMVARTDSPSGLIPSSTASLSPAADLVETTRDLTLVSAPSTSPAPDSNQASRETLLVGVNTAPASPSTAAIAPLVSTTEPSAVEDFPLLASVSAPAQSPAISPAPLVASSAPVANVVGSTPVSEPTPSQLTIAQNLAAIREEVLVVADSSSSALLGTLVSLSEPTTTEISAEPAVLPSNPRHLRLLAMADSEEMTDTKAGMANLRERMVHRLVSDESAYASGGRMGYGADRLSVRF
jgi:hypothetical protein